jgi:hypothetical protein
MPVLTSCWPRCAGSSSAEWWSLSPSAPERRVCLSCRATAVVLRRSLRGRRHRRRSRRCDPCEVGDVSEWVEHRTPRGLLGFAPP